MLISTLGDRSKQNDHVRGRNHFDDAGKPGALKGARRVWRGAFGIGLDLQYLAGCLPYFHRSLGQECLLVHQPGTLSQVAEFTEAYLAHYNSERPNQARSCGNQPPRVAYPAFPTLPKVPETVDPDHWLVQVDKRAFARTIRAGGDLTINHQDYYVSRSLAGQRVTRLRSTPPRSALTSGSLGDASSRSPSKACMERPCPSRSM
jgi:hypothetical protein